MKIHTGEHSANSEFKSFMYDSTLDEAQATVAGRRIAAAGSATHRRTIAVVPVEMINVKKAAKNGVQLDALKREVHMLTCL